MLYEFHIATYLNRGNTKNVVCGACFIQPEDEVFDLRLFPGLFDAKWKNKQM